MLCARYAVVLVAAWVCVACASTPETESVNEFCATTGIITQPKISPFVIDITTNIIRLNKDGTMPRMAVHVHRSMARPFIISYRVYRRVRGSDRYVLTETSPLWRVNQDAFIRPDFTDGVFLGEYRFAISINLRPWRVVEFRVVQSGI